MNTFWLKIAGVVVVIIVVVVLLANFLSSGIEEATDFERVEKLAEEQEARLQAELAEAERKAKQAKSKPVQVKRVDVRKSVEPPKPKEMALEDQVRAQQLYQMAETEFKIGRKPLMTFHKCVRYCRELIEEYPDSPEAAKARVLLRKIPKRYRKQYNITDEEMGL